MMNKFGLDEHTADKVATLLSQNPASLAINMITTGSARGILTAPANDILAETLYATARGMEGQESFSSGLRLDNIVNNARATNDAQYAAITGDDNYSSIMAKEDPSMFGNSGWT